MVVGVVAAPVYKIPEMGQRLFVILFIEIYIANAVTGFQVFFRLPSGVMPKYRRIAVFSVVVLTHQVEGIAFPAVRFQQRGQVYSKFRRFVKEVDGLVVFSGVKKSGSLIEGDHLVCFLYTVAFHTQAFEMPYGRFIVVGAEIRIGDQFVHLVRSGGLRVLAQVGVHGGDGLPVVAQVVGHFGVVEVSIFLNGFVIRSIHCRLVSG